MHFQIYIPGARPVPNPDVLKDVGLGDLFGGATFVGCSISQRDQECPPPGEGALITWESAGGILNHGYRPDHQTWWPSLARDDRDLPRYYVGVWNQSPPAPAELARPRQFGGHAVRLLDGQEWLIPAAVRLPVVLTDDFRGEPVWEVQEIFRDFWRDSQQMYQDLVVNAIVEDGRLQTTVHADWRDYAARALAMNYRFPRELLTRLKLCGEDELYKLCLATVDGQQIGAFERGKALGLLADTSAAPGS